MTRVPGGKELTAAALAALQRTGISRRSFLRGAGALIVAFRGHPAQGAWAGAVSPAADSNRLDAWIALDSQGRVTAYTGKCELGQGLYTAQLQLIAEELCVSLDRVNLIQCDTALTPDQGTTSGAQSHPTNFNDGNLALAAATARQVLLERAAARWNMPVDRLRAAQGMVSVKGDSSQSISYGRLVEGEPLSLALDPRAARKPADQWTVLGKPSPRAEFPAIAAGRFEFVHNVRLPAMLHGQVVRPPTVGATLLAVDHDSIRDLPGLIRVVVKNNFVGLVAEKPYQALQAAAQLKCRWKPGGELPDQAHFDDYLRNRPSSRDSYLVRTSDVDEKMAGSARIMKATYFFPYQMHGSVASSCAVADVRENEATVWSATQGVYPLRDSLAELLQIPARQIRVIFRMGAGCYGLNGADTVSFDAALLSQSVGRPVRVQLTRQDEMAWENFGSAFLIDQKAGLDEQGNILAWDYESWSLTRGGRPGSNRPGNVVTGYLAGHLPAPFAARAAEEPAHFSNTSNGVPPYASGRVGDRRAGTGTIDSQRVLTHTVESPFWTGPLRSPARLQNTFAHESFLDEIASSLGQDPVAYRLRHLKDRRLIEALEAAAQAANWDERPSPRANQTGPVASGRGVSIVFYKGNNGYCAVVAEVEVDRRTGQIGVTRLIIANDSGPISNPDGLRNQLEGGALHGVSRALLEEVTWDRERVTSIDWPSYGALFLDAPTPRIETILIDRPQEKAMGAGETAVTVVPAAIANAVFDALGVRLRQIPFTPQRVLAALKKQSGAGTI